MMHDRIEYMAYTPTAWVNGVAPAINATNLNKIETGIDDAHAGDIDDNVLTSAKLSFGTWEKIAEVVLDADADYVEFDDLNLKEDVAYMLVIIVQEALSSVNHFKIAAGDGTSPDMTSTNYHCAFMDVSDTTIDFERLNSNYIIYHLDADNYFVAYCFLSRTVNLKFTAQCEAVVNTGATLRWNSFRVTHDVALTEINCVRVYGVNANGINAGSTFMLFKMRSK